MKFDFAGAVDVGKGGLDGVAVAGAVVLAAGFAGDGAEGFFVDGVVSSGDEAVVDFVAVGVPIGVGDDEGVGASADGVNGDVAVFGDDGGLLRREGAAVVGAVGEEDDEGAQALVAGVVGAGFLFEAGEGHAEAVADGGLPSGEADVEAVELAGKPVVVEGERREGVGLVGEDDEADAVVGAFVDEGFDDGADGVDAAEALALVFIVFDAHGAGEVDDEHEVVALGVDFVFVLDFLRAGEGGGEEDERERGEDGGEARGAGERGAVPGGGKGDDEDGGGAAGAENDYRGDDEQREEPER